MSINLDNALGIHEAALRLRSTRTELLASNLANADTPNYKARDIDFKAALEQAQGMGELRTTHQNHFAGGEDPGINDPLYRIPSQASVDGNTVDSQREKAEFMQNALQYQTSLHFIDGTMKTLRSAIRGE